MKRFFLIIVYVCITAGSFAQSEFFYTDKGEKEIFKVRTDKLILKAKSAEEAKALCKQEFFISAYDVCFDWVIASIDPQNTRLEYLLERQDIIDATYALEYADGTLQYPTDQIYVKLKEGQSMDRFLDNTDLRRNVEEVKLFNPYSELYSITLNVKLGDILKICRDLFESGSCESASPPFFREMKPSNQYYSNQWGLKNTGQYGGTSGFDIKAEQAWNITKGNSDIKVAVIDEGVDLTHPDLQANLLTGYDATISPPGGANGSPWAGNAHGTNCAGIIGAVDNSIGIIGVAPNVKMVPIRIAYDYYDNGLWTTYDSWIADGIRYAWETAQVDVLSNSWGGGSWSQSIVDAINNAVTKGRKKNGISLGCVVVFSTGNNNFSTVGYPANLSNVIAVGAMSQCGTRKRSSTDIQGVSCDGEGWWGSNYGDALDVVAPGVKIYSTDIQGSAGYNTASGTAGNYFDSFNGTSSACPHVAGIAALILSVKPDLTNTQVSRAIFESCTKLSSYTFSNFSHHSYGTWNNQVGHGLVNAIEAVASVLLTISGPGEVCSSSSFTLQNPPSGTIYWTVSDPSIYTVTSSGNPTTVTRGSAYGSAVLYAHSGSTSGPVIAAKTISCPQPYIDGPGEACSGGTFYTLYNSPSSTIYWTVTGPFSFNLGSSSPTFYTTTGTHIVSVFRTTGSASSGTLTARIGNSSGAIVATKTITPCVMISGQDEVCIYGSTFTVLNPPSGNVYWSVTGPFSFNYDSSVTSYIGEWPTLYRREGSGATGTLTARTGSASGTIIATKTFTACVAFFGVEPVCFGGSTFFLYNQPSGTMYWKVEEGPFSFSMSDPNVKTTTGTMPTLYRTTDTGNSGYITVRTGSYTGTVIAYRYINPCPYITGPSEVCTNGSSFTLIVPPYGTLYWSVTGPFSFSFSSTVTTSTGNPVTVYRTTGGGNGTLTVRTGSASGTIVDSKTITPCNPPVIDGPGTVCIEGSSFTLLNPIPSPIYWTLTGPFSFSSTSTVTSTSTSGSSITVYRTLNSGTTGTLSARSGSTSGTVVASKTITPCAAISGSSTVCYDGSQFTLLNPPSGTIYWTVSNTSLFDVVSSGNPTTVTRKGTGAVSSVTLSARTGSISGTVVATKTITPCVVPTIGGNYTICTGQTISFTHHSSPIFTWNSGYNISITGPGSSPYTDQYIYAVGTSPGSGWVSVSYGNIQYSIFYVTVTDCRGGSSPYSIYPNPVSDILNITIDAQAVSEARSQQPSLTNGQPLKFDPTFDIRLYDGQGFLLLQTSSKGGLVQFDVSNLSDGIYYLHIYDGSGNTPFMTQIVVEH